MARGVCFSLGYRVYPFLAGKWPGIPVFGYCPFFNFFYTWYLLTHFFQDLFLAVELATLLIGSWTCILMDVHARELNLHFNRRPCELLCNNATKGTQHKATGASWSCGPVMTIIVFFSFFSCYHKVSQQVVYLPVLFFHQQTIYHFFYEDNFFLYDPWIQPTKTRLISEQSI